MMFILFILFHLKSLQVWSTIDVSYSRVYCSCAETIWYGSEDEAISFVKKSHDLVLTSPPLLVYLQ